MHRAWLRGFHLLMLSAKGPPEWRGNRPPFAPTRTTFLPTLPRLLLLQVLNGRERMSPRIAECYAPLVSTLTSEELGSKVGKGNQISPH